ncbi:DNA glycosylase [Rickenella mellea]|uniref:DNA glycosylase n=1 Tax=Rickenella mellea TaxID=50990 RepID=A0A4Y7QB10_9AGAM|nr:DNA glycosylase [Rickenella mellea]
MPATRSATRSISGAAASAVAASAKARSPVKRKAKPAEPEEQTSPKKLRENALTTSTNGTTASGPTVLPQDTPSLLPAVLSFSFEDAKKHLIKVDSRFEDLFSKLKCRPYEHLERVDPFWTLVQSILGQQISWLAARSITHRFIRIYDPSIPEKPVVEDGVLKTKYTMHPTAPQVASTDIATLRAAGLSGRKAEYVRDLAERFADGRLSATKILEADDEKLSEMLIEVRGIGQWTVDMFAIFSLRRPDILPVGDLGVQRGVLRWFLALHSPAHPYTISPKKLPKAPADDAEPASDGESSEIPSPNGVTDPPAGTSSNVSSILPAPPSTPKKGVKQSNSETDPIAPLPPQFTPSINRTLNKLQPSKPPLPEGMTVQILKSRLDGKKKIKGAFITPKEMEVLTDSWRPYRSLGVYYMWALAEEKMG